MSRITLVLLLGFMAGLAYSALDKDGCYWSGTSPICHGSCKPGETTNASSSSGAEGETPCLTGHKKKCCKIGFVTEKPTAIVIEVQHKNTP